MIYYDSKIVRDNYYNEIIVHSERMYSKTQSVQLVM